MKINRNLEIFEKNINFKFKDKKNLINAITHPSFIKEKKVVKKVQKKAAKKAPTTKKKAAKKPAKAKKEPTKKGKK